MLDMAKGVMVVSYGAREAAIVDALGENVDLFIYDKNNNPFNRDRATQHVADKDFTVDGMVEFAREYKDKIDFVIATSEDPIIAGIRDQVEAATGIPVLCSTAEYAIERSKIYQRILLDKIAPKANPDWNPFYHDIYDGRPKEKLRKDFDACMRELGYQAVIKPDRPGLGKGVAVSGDHFSNEDEAWEHFRSIYESGNDVLVERKIDGEEFSLQFFSDGQRLIPTPAVRDYKRRFDDDRGPNTGGMGAYSDITYWLPFMTENDYRTGVEIGNKVFTHLRGNGINIGLRGVPLYFGFTVAKDGIKKIEINTRPGDPEFQNTLAVLDVDFLALCNTMLEGNLYNVPFKKLATVGAYIVPDSYPDGDPKGAEKERRIDLTQAYQLSRGMNGRLRVYPASIEDKDDGNYALGSRAVYFLGTGERIADARDAVMRGVASVKDLFFGHRTDIASPEYIHKSITHVQALRN